MPDLTHGDLPFIRTDTEHRDLNVMLMASIDSREVAE